MNKFIHSANARQTEICFEKETYQFPNNDLATTIVRFESCPRNLYSGCMIIYDSTGAMDAALVLRSFFQKDKQAWLQTGAGIIDMSKPEKELEETREKLQRAVV